MGNYSNKNFFKKGRLLRSQTFQVWKSVSLCLVKEPTSRGSGWRGGKYGTGNRRRRPYITVRWWSVTENRAIAAAHIFNLPLTLYLYFYLLTIFSSTSHFYFIYRLTINRKLNVVVTEFKKRRIQWLLRLCLSWGKGVTFYIYKEDSYIFLSRHTDVLCCVGSIDVYRRVWI